MGPKLSVSLRGDFDRDEFAGRAMNEFRCAWMRNVHSSMIDWRLSPKRNGIRPCADMAPQGAMLLCMGLFSRFCVQARRPDYFRLFLAETIQPHDFGAFAGLGRFLGRVIPGF